MTDSLVHSRIVVGMPVYNAQTTITSAIASILAYPGDDLRLVISDNDSNDNTHAICEGFAQRDPRVVLVRQQQNIGAEANFDYVLSSARCQYFMWAAADDLRSPDFIEICVDFLDRHLDYAGATCPVKEAGGDFNPVAMGDGSLDNDDPRRRMLESISRMHANGRFYSLLRYSALEGWLPQRKDYMAADWALALHLLKRGKMKRMDTGWVQLGIEGTSRQLTIFSRYRKRKIHWLLPLYEFSEYALNAFDGATIANKAELVARLLKINVIGAVMQWRYELRLWRARLRASIDASRSTPTA